MCQIHLVTCKTLDASAIASDSSLRQKRDVPERKARTSAIKPSYTVVSDDEHPRGRPDSHSGKVYVNHEYHDHSYDRESDGSYSSDSSSGEHHHHKSHHTTTGKKGPRGGVSTPFPEKLHMMLADADAEGFDDIVSWKPHGRCFGVIKPKEFVTKIMPRYFKQTKLTSFQRQLNLYGFCRLTSGTDRGAYYHELFLRGRPFLCKRMMRTRIKGTGIKAANNPEREPNFYQMPFVRPLEDTPSVPPTPPSLPVEVVEDEPMEDVVEDEPMVEEEEPQEEDDEEEEMKEPEEIVSLGGPTPPSFPMTIPLIMPVLPKSMESSLELTKSSPPVVTPPTTPLQDPLSPPVILSDWDLSDPADEPIVFEGKTFHYLDPCGFECLDEERGFDDVWKLVTNKDDFGFFADI